MKTEKHLLPAKQLVSLPQARCAGRTSKPQEPLPFHRQLPQGPRKGRLQAEGNEDLRFPAFWRMFAISCWPNAEFPGTVQAAPLPSLEEGVGMLGSGTWLGLHSRLCSLVQLKAYVRTSVVGVLAWGLGLRAERLRTETLANL